MTADEMNENGEGWRDLIAQWCCIPIPMLSLRLFVIIVHVVNAAFIRYYRSCRQYRPQQRRNRTARTEKPDRNGGETETQQRRKRTARAEETNRNGGKNEPPVNIMKPLTITHIIR